MNRTKIEERCYSLYTSKNGYTGILYGKSSMSIYDKSGYECMHTGSRAINTLDELRDFVDGFHKMLKKLNEVSE